MLSFILIQNLVSMSHDKDGAASIREISSLRSDWLGAYDILALCILQPSK